MTPTERSGGADPAREERERETESESESESGLDE